MVNFVALNAPPETDIDIENHTKEVQIETGLKLYQRALSFQYVKDWSSAAKVYEELLNLDILNLNSIEKLCNVTSERMIRLIYLVYKNYGSFIFDTMTSGFKSNHESLTLYTCLKNYSVALKYDHNDIELWMRVSEVSESLGLNRILRFSLESIIYSGMDSLIDSEYSFEDISCGNILFPEVYKSLINLNSLLHFIKDFTSLLRIERIFLYCKRNGRLQIPCVDIEMDFQENRNCNLMKSFVRDFLQNISSVILKVPERNFDSISVTLVSFLLNRYERNDFEFYSHIEFIENLKRNDKCSLETNDVGVHKSQAIINFRNDSEFSEMSQKNLEESSNLIVTSLESQTEGDNIESLKNFGKRLLDNEAYEKSLRVSKRIRSKDGINSDHEKKDICFVNSLNEIFGKVGMFFGEYSKFTSPVSEIVFSENDVIDELRQILYSGFLTEDVINDVIQEKNLSELPRVFYLDLSKHLDISVNVDGKENLEVIDEFESFIDADKYLLEEISLEWFKKFTFYSYSNLGTLYFQKKWSPKLSNAIIEIAINVEIECLYFFANVFKKRIFSNNSENDTSMQVDVDIFQILGWAQTILELFLNYYIKNERNDYFEKIESNDLIFQKQRICRWKLLVADLMFAYDISFDTLQALFSVFIVDLTDNFYPFDHYTEPSDIDCFSAEQILPFILSLINRRRSGLTLPRTDIKIALDKIYNVLENAFDSKVLNTFNFSLIGAYLSEDICLKDIVACQRGLLKINTIGTRSNNNDCEAFVLALSDVNFVQAEIHISMFRSRGKTTSTRGTNDLELALKYLMVMILLIFTSWHALGLTFGWLSDDGLTWSAEYIYNERKSISELRKKSLKAYMMAFSLFISSNNDMNDNLVHFFSNLQYDFGMQLYTSVHPPLDMEPFVSKHLQFYKGSDGLSKREFTSEISYCRIIELSMKCFSFASKKKSNDWKCFYMLGKTLRKLKCDPKKVLDQYVRAIKLVPRKNIASGQAIIIEPDYKLVSSILKYINAGFIDLKTAITYLQETVYNDNISEYEISMTKDDIIEMCLSVLKRIRFADKKHWHHRPVFRCAKILESQSKIQSAKDELETLFSIRTFGKAVINIWRPDFERPGRHFYYAKKYTLYLIKLLEETNDRDGLKILLKRLRKASSSIYHHRYVWDKLCNIYLNLLRRNASIPECPDTVWNIPLVFFNLIATKFEQFLDNTTLDRYDIDDIRDVLELKKINGGLYDVEIIDQFLIDMYFNMYLSFSKEIDILNNSLIDLNNILNKRQNILNNADNSDSYSNKNDINISVDNAINNLNKLHNDNMVLVSRKDVLSRLSFFYKVTKQVIIMKYLIFI
ncbi:hypothetical protein PORY_002116 [Pneumocystis oryctolagi]|uniref:Uncharacterized protein n=1 Tax=Pneumocystis oryctolagi TaxID=42067 RepID=A0ACB7CA38_9ASCO|nr:hypothetical protein PORY_002116 [Pneumocystis oryctolagi]